jgi:uncharacterized protein (TIGR02145 family)
VTGQSAGTATITYTIDGAGGCSDATATRTVTVTAHPSAGILSGSQSICDGSTTNFSSTQSGGSWSSTGTATVNSSGVVSGQSTGTATITYTVNGTGGCSDVDVTALRTITIESCPCGSATNLTDTRDSKTYEIVEIGDQCWMSENLNYTPTSGNSWCYDDITSNCTTYGKLYDWNGAMDGSSSSPNDVQGACPTGWHLPSDEEWKELEMELGMSQTEADIIGSRGTNEGDQLKASSFGGNNSSGFTALPRGSRNTNGSFNGEGSYGYWWSATESGTAAWSRLLFSSQSDVSRNTYVKGFGFSVRCVRN